MKKIEKSKQSMNFPLKKNYRIKSIAKSTTIGNIYFFSPKGIDPNQINSSQDMCTAEMPCQFPTSELLQRIGKNAKLWFAPGTYDISDINDGHNRGKILSLLQGQGVYGRSDDFRYQAQGDERPIFNGAMLWTGYTQHSSAYGYLENIQMVTQDNEIETELGYSANANIYAPSLIFAFNADLKKQSNLSTTTVSTNILSESIMLERSNIQQTVNGHSFINSNLTGTRINMSESNLEIDATSEDATVSNIYSEFNNDSSNIYIVQSNMYVSSHYRAVAINAPDFQSLNMIDSTLNVVSKGSDYFSAIGFNASIGGITHYLNLVNSKINVESDQSVSHGVYVSGELNMSIDNSKISIKSPSESFFVSGWEKKNIVFHDAPSSINLTASPWIFDSQTSITNQSFPLSMCQVNENKPVECMDNI
jgi:hypothetical protein